MEVMSEAVDGRQTPFTAKQPLLRLMPLVDVVVAPVSVSCPVMVVDALTVEDAVERKPVSVEIPATESVLPSVVAPVTPSVDANVAAPVTPRVEPSVVAPVTPSVPELVVFTNDARP